MTGFQVTGEGAGLVVVCAEASYTACGCFPDMKKTVPGKNDLITLATMIVRGLASVSKSLVNRGL